MSSLKIDAENVIDTSKVNRFEIIDHTKCKTCDGTGRIYTNTDSAAGQSISLNKECQDCRGMGSPGRSVYFHNQNLQLDISIQDDGETLKVFIHERYHNGTM